MKINSYCQDCGVSIKYYNKAIRCWNCHAKFRQLDAKWLIKYCIDCGKQLKNKQAKRCKICAGKLRQKHYFCIDCGCDLKRSYKAKRCRKCNGINTKGINNPSYIDGRSKEEYGIEFTEELKEQIRKRDNYTCQICKLTQNKQEKRFKKSLEVHHKDCNKKNQNINNLIALCTSCHLKLHNQKRFRNKYKEYINEK